MTASRWLWLIAAGLVVVVAQLTLGDELRIAGVHPELVWVLPVAAGLTSGPKVGMAAGLAGGAIADLFLTTPFGLTALVGVVLGFALGRLGEEGIGDLGGSAWWVAPSLALGAGLLAPAGYALCGAAIGHPSYLSATVGVICLLDAVASALVVRLVMRVLGPLIADESARAGPLEPVRGTA